MKKLLLLGVLLTGCASTLEMRSNSFFVGCMRGVHRNTELSHDSAIHECKSLESMYRLEQFIEDEIEAQKLNKQERGRRHE